MNYILEFTKVLAWPITIFISLLIFRKEVKSVISMITEVKFGNISVLINKLKLEAKIRESEHDTVKKENIEPITNIFDLSDEDFIFLEKIKKQNQYNVTSEEEKYRFNSLVNEGYFTKKDDGTYEVTASAKDIVGEMRNL